MGLITLLCLFHSGYQYDTKNEQMFAYFLLNQNFKYEGWQLNTKFQMIFYNFYHPKNLERVWVRDWG